MCSKISSKPSENFNSQSNEALGSMLILHNDDHNVFDYVVESLIEVCEHNTIQAEQCTYIAHHKGQCELKIGTPETLKPLKEELIRRGLSATISTLKA